MNYLIIFIGAGLGGMARHAVNVTTLRLDGIAVEPDVLAPPPSVPPVVSNADRAPD